MPETNLHDITAKKRLILPIGDHTYEIPRVSGRLWLDLQNQQVKLEQGIRDGKTVEQVAADLGGSDVERWRQCIGPDLFDRMLDELDAEELVMAGNTAFLWQLGQFNAADLYWTTGGKGRAVTQTPPTTPESIPSGRTGDAASMTPTPNSGSGTTTRRKPPRKTGSGGRKSSGTAKS